MRINPGACDVCGWQIDRTLDGRSWCRCTIQHMRSTVPDVKLRAFIREWDRLGEDTQRCDRDRQEHGEEPLGALLILGPGTAGGPE